MGAEASSIQNQVASCRACKDSGDKQTDTVKVDLDRIRDTSTAGKENDFPGQMMVKETAAQRQQRADQEKLEEHEVLRRRDEELRRRKEEERRLQEGQRAEERRGQEEAERQRQLEALRKRQADEERARRQAEEAKRIKMVQIAEEERRNQAELIEQQRRQEEAERQRQEQEALAAKEQLETAARKQQLRGFLEKQGFQALDEKKVKKGLVNSTFSYPLHAAVEAKDAEAVGLLLWAGADPKVQNSKKQTPLVLAQAKNKQGSHAKVIAALAA